jgi:hypothetical protein
MFRRSVMPSSGGSCRFKTLITRAMLAPSRFTNHAVTHCQIAELCSRQEMVTKPCECAGVECDELTSVLSSHCVVCAEPTVLCVSLILADNLLKELWCWIC